MKNIIPIAIAIAVVFGAGGFYAGTLYQKNQDRALRGNFGRGVGNFESPAANVTRRSGGLQGGFASGQIIAKDNNSITLKLRDGSSRIIFYSGSTQISKQTNGTVDDLAVGSTAMVVGSANSDGSVNAQSISLRPAGMPEDLPAGGNLPADVPIPTGPRTQFQP